MPADNGLDSFVRAQTQQAAQAEVKGHWAAAALAWETVSLVRPADAQARARLADVRGRIDRLSADRQSAAEAAQRRGDWDAATLAYLDVLALDPTRRSAADALRQIERERNRRSMVGRFARPATVARRGPAEAEAPAADMGGDGTRSANSVREHATMLVSQGDLDGAIQMLRDAAGRNPGAHRPMLADLYVQRAESLKQSQPEAARAAAEAALAIDRRHPAALAVLQQLPKPKPRPRAPATAASAVPR